MAGLGPLDRRFGLRPEGQPFGQTEARLTRLEAGGREDIFIVTDPLYGAVGDGVTDDTAAIQAAIDAAAAVRGTVWFPYSADEYMVSDTLTLASGVIIAGAGKRAVTIKLTAAFPLGHNLFDGTNVQDVKVRDLGFNGSDLVLTAKALLFSQSSTDKRCRIEHCLFEDFLGS